MRERARARQREWLFFFFFFFSVYLEGRQAVYLPVEISLEEEDVYFFTFGHNLGTRGFCCPLCATVWWFSVCLQNRWSGVGVGGGLIDSKSGWGFLRFCLGIPRPSCAEPGLTPEVTQLEREETPCRLPISVKIFVPHGWGLGVCVCVCVCVCVRACVRACMCMCVFNRMVSGTCGPPCVASAQAVLPPFATTHTHSSHLCRTSVCPSLSTHTHTHTHTRVRPPRQVGNHEKATLCSQTAQSDHSGALTPMQPLLPTEMVCMCASACASVGLSACADKCVWTR